MLQYGECLNVWQQASYGRLVTVFWLSKLFMKCDFSQDVFDLKNLFPQWQWYSLNSSTQYGIAKLYWPEKLQTCIFEHFVIFFVKFTRIQRWNRLIHTVLACAKFQRDFHFYKVNFDWFMCCKMCDLIASRKCHPPKHVLRKSVSIKTEVSKQPFPLFVMLLERYVLWKHLIFFCVFILSSKHSRGWENSQKFCKPSAAS